MDQDGSMVGPSGSTAKVNPYHRWALASTCPPTNTNNAVGATIGVAKKHAGSHASGAKHIGKLMLTQAGFWSNAKWDANAKQLGDHSHCLST